jgi:molybdopterin molybdotransferase
MATRTKPPFPVSAMDGYALPASPKAGDHYQVIGEVPAGGRTLRGWSARGGCAHLHRRTRARWRNSCAHSGRSQRDGDTLTVAEDPGTATNIRPAGGDFRARRYPDRQRHTPCAPASGAGGFGQSRNLQVHPKPRIAILMNGDELAWPGKDAPDDAIIASNGFGLAALARRYGAQLDDLALLGDDRNALEAYIGRLRAPTFCSTIGGASVGDYDLVRPALEAQGFALDFPKVALRPGKPTLFGRKGV